MHVFFLIIALFNNEPKWRVIELSDLPSCLEFKAGVEEVIKDRQGSIVKSECIVVQES